MASEKRNSFMDKLLGRGQSKEVRSKLRGIQEDLDAAGIERKAKKALVTKALQKKLKQLNFKAEDISEVVEAVTDVVVQELGSAGVIDAAIESGAVAAEDELGVQEIIMNAVNAGIEATMMPEEEVEVEMADAGAEDELSDGGGAGGDAGDEDKLANEEIRRGLKSLTTHISEQSEDMSELVQTMVSLAKSLKLANETNALLEGRLSKLETTLAGRPRQASKAVETQFEAPPKVQTEIEKGMGEGVEMLFGHIPLRPKE